MDSSHSSLVPLSPLSSDPLQEPLVLSVTLELLPGLAWENPELRRPRVRVLGTTQAWCPGEAPLPILNTLAGCICTLTSDSQHGLRSCYRAFSKGFSASSWQKKG